MYRDASLEAKVARAYTDQRGPINQWKADGYTCTDIVSATFLQCIGTLEICMTANCSQLRQISQPSPMATIGVCLFLTVE